MAIDVTCVVLWGLDHQTGEFKDEKHIELSTVLTRADSNNSSWLKSLVPQRKQQHTVGELLRTELEKVHEALEEEESQFRTEYTTEKEKSKRLMFLFQKDLMPGISGQILESKGQRDDLVVKGVSRSAKILAWLFLTILNASMLFYIFLFAISQDPYRQRAWARSFALWLVVEIIFVSSAVVCFMHVFIPSITMKDVTKIRGRLVESIVKYHQAMKAKDAGKGWKEIEDEKDSSDHNQFNVARYLFVSYRMATKYPDLKVSQIIRQFPTPWPRQSYHHVTDVSKNYNRKFTAITRSVSLIVMFFLTNLLAVPLSIQDMVMQMAATIVTGYTVLIHIQLFKIFPVLVIVPTIFIAALLHFFIQSGKVNNKLQLAKMLKGESELANEGGKKKKHHKGNEAKENDNDNEAGDWNMELSSNSEVSDNEDHSIRLSSVDEDGQHHHNEVDDSFEDDIDSLMKNGMDQNAIHLRKHVNRRQSIQQGISALHQMRKEVHSSPLAVQNEGSSAMTEIEIDLNNNENSSLHKPIRMAFLPKDVLNYRAKLSSHALSSIVSKPQDLSSVHSSQNSDELMASEEEEEDSLGTDSSEDEL